MTLTISFKTLLNVIDFYPEHLNQWYEKGWAKRTKWKFLNDFNEAVATKAD